jgi:hypothetical protein
LALGPALLACALLLACGEEPATLGVAAGRNPATARDIERERSMATLELAIVPEHSEVLSGESLPVDVTLTNAGPDRAEVRSPDEQSAFQYLLKPREEGGREYLLSVEDWLTSSWENPPKPRKLKTREVGPGESLSYKEEIAEYAGEPLLPGSYRLTVLYEHEGGQFVSPEVPLSIVVPRPTPTGLVAAPGPSEGRLGLVVAHRVAEGGVVLYQRESDSGRPATGVLYRRREWAEASALGGIASAVELTENRGIRWFAWIEGGALGAGYAEGESLFGTLGPKPLELESPSIHPIGWQITLEDTVFVALGTQSDGPVQIASVTFEAGKDGTVETASLDAAGPPQLWAAQYRPGSDPAAFDVVWTEAGEDGARVRRQTLRPGTRKREEPALLGRRDAPVAALSLDPVAGPEPSVVDVLLGPAGKEAQMTLLRIPLAGGEPVGEWTFPAPRGPEGELPSAWRLPDRTFPRQMALAWSTGRLVAGRVEGEGTWTTVADPAPEEGHLALASIRGVLYGVWADPETGIHVREIAGLDALGAVSEPVPEFEEDEDEEYDE